LDSDLSWIVQDFILFLNRRIFKREINYFWVNQGSKYKQELKANCIVAPINNVHHHKRLKEMFEGDVVLHYSDSSLLAKSIVIKEFEEAPRPYGNNLENELVVKLKYEELYAPISIDIIQKQLSSHLDLLPKKYSPFDKNLRPYQSYCLSFNEPLFKLLLSDKSIEFKNKPIMKNPNIILYGPPGTGKTYSTIELAYEIINGEKAMSHEIAQKFFQKEKGNQIDFITFHQNMAYEDFIQGIKPDIDSDDVKFLKKDGLFKVMCDRARIEDNFEEVYQKFVEDIQDNSITLKTEAQSKKFDISRINSMMNCVIKAHTKNPSEMVVTKDHIHNYIKEEGHVTRSSYTIPIVKYLRKKYNLNSKNNLYKNYVLIIDEINRANISRVFGELISLIEKDKRLGQKHEISATLSSGDKLIVPPNLYIIGTMNTADKSIALLDIALRRRFDFKKMYPQSRLVIEKHQESFTRMNKKIRELKGADFQIGHSYFMGEDFDLNYTMEYKVIPLLYEYFMNDEDAIKEVLSVAGFEINESKDSDSGLIEFSGVKETKSIDNSDA
jgi:DNA polymerase III delta prime subunit